jgi:hypothetical protein
MPIIWCNGFPDDLISCAWPACHLRSWYQKNFETRGENSLMTSSNVVLLLYCTRVALRPQIFTPPWASCFAVRCIQSCRIDYCVAFRGSR